MGAGEGGGEIQKVGTVHFLSGGFGGGRRGKGFNVNV